MFDFDELDDQEEIDLEIFLHIKKHRLMSMDHDKAMSALFSRYNLLLHLEYFKEFNPSCSSPYHNNYHSYCVALNAFEGAYYEKLDDSLIKPLLIAALFHDFDHSAGKSDDAVNIVNAIQGFRTSQKFAGLFKLTDADAKLVEELIAVTKYPWEGDPVTKAQAIIRDADLMQCYEEREVLLLQQYQGLRTEIQTQRGVQLLVDEFACKMREFLNTQVVWYTAWGQQKAVVLDWQSKVDRLCKVIEADES